MIQGSVFPTPHSQLFGYRAKPAVKAPHHPARSNALRVHGLYGAPQRLGLLNQGAATSCRPCRATLLEWPPVSMEPAPGR
jgi:hypothetical protein